MKQNETITLTYKDRIAFDAIAEHLTVMLEEGLPSDFFGTHKEAEEKVKFVFTVYSKLYLDHQNCDPVGLQKLLTIEKALEEEKLLKRALKKRARVRMEDDEEVDNLLEILDCIAGVLWSND